MTTRERVRNFLVEELRCGRQPEELTDDLSLIDERVIDSMGIFQIVSFLENDLGVEVADEELVPENFGTIAAIARLVDAKSATSG